MQRLPPPAIFSLSRTRPSDGTSRVRIWHLSGQDDEGKDFVMGIYPMLQDETCFILAVDFDKEGWREDTKARSNEHCSVAENFKRSSSRVEQRKGRGRGTVQCGGARLRCNV